MRLRRLLAPGLIALVVVAAGCRDNAVRDWLTTYTAAENAYLVATENALNSLGERVCILEGTPCPGPDLVGPPPPPTWP